MIWSVILGWLLALVAVAWGQEPVVPVGSVVTLEQAIALALRNNRQMRLTVWPRRGPAGGRGEPLGYLAWESAHSSQVTHMPRIAILLPLTVGASAVICTILLHALAVSATVHFVRHARTRGRTGTSVWIDMAIVALVIAFAFVAHLLEIAVWAVVFLLCGEFPEFGTAYYHSAVNYTTLGYGDVIMTPSWRLLGPLEAANGALMVGVSTAIIFAVLQRLIEARFVDLRD